MRLLRQFCANLLQLLGVAGKQYAIAQCMKRLSIEPLEERRVLSGLSPVISIDPAAAQKFWSEQLATGSPLLPGPVIDFAPPGAAHQRCGTGEPRPNRRGVAPCAACGRHRSRSFGHCFKPGRHGQYRYGHPHRRRGGKREEKGTQLDINSSRVSSVENPAGDWLIFA